MTKALCIAALLGIGCAHEYVPQPISKSLEGRTLYRGQGRFAAVADMEGAPAPEGSMDCSMETITGSHIYYPICRYKDENDLDRDPAVPLVAFTASNGNARIRSMGWQSQ